MDTYSHEQAVEIAVENFNAGFVQGQAVGAEQKEQEIKGLLALQRLLKEY